MCACVHNIMCVYMNVCLYTCMCVFYVYLCIYVHVCVSVCLYVDLQSMQSSATGIDAGLEVKTLCINVGQLSHLASLSPLQNNVLSVLVVTGLLDGLET